GVRGERPVRIELALGHDLDVVAHDVWHLAASVYNWKRRRRRIGVLKLDAEATALACQRAWDENPRNAIQLVLGGRTLRLQLADGQKVHRRGLQARDRE